MSDPENRPLTENNEPPVNYQVDACGLSCPLPLLKMKQALNVIGEGEVVLVKATDPASERDFNAYIAMTHHSMVAKKNQDQYLYWITKNTQG
jgi:tRNA 2-thiouridine synthesizing protein A